MSSTKMCFCACLLTRIVQPASPLSPVKAVLGQKWMHTSAMMSSWTKETRSKKTQIKLSQQFKVDGATKPGITDDLMGSEHRGVVIPDINTPGMLVNGVRFDELPVLHLKCSTNNTIAHLTDHTGGNCIGRTSCGQEGFRNSKKSSTVAAQATGLSIGYMAKKAGVQYVRVVLKGIGSGRLPVLKGVDMAGIKMVSLTDDRPIFANGPRPRKPRQL